MRLIICVWFMCWLIMALACVLCMVIVACCVAFPVCFPGLMTRVLDCHFILLYCFHVVELWFVCLCCLSIKNACPKCKLLRLFAYMYVFYEIFRFQCCMFMWCSWCMLILLWLWYSYVMFRLVLCVYVILQLILCVIVSICCNWCMFHFRGCTVLVFPFVICDAFKCWVYFSVLMLW